MLMFFHFTVKRAKGRTPVPSEHPSRPSFDDAGETIMHIVEEAPQDHQTAKQLVSGAPLNSHHDTEGQQ